MDKADTIYRFLVLGFRVGRNVTEQLADPVVNRMLKLERGVMREKDHFYGFVRFRELNSGILFAKIAPKHHQLPLAAEHFADRYPTENWMIYERRHEVCVHEAGRGWWITKDVTPSQRMISDVSDSQRQFEELWKQFYEAIGIRERENPRCRMSMMPKMYWSNMPEMMGK